MKLKLKVKKGFKIKIKKSLSQKKMKELNLFEL